MIRKLLLASTATALLTGAASAADLPRRAAPPVFTPVPVFTWTGFYAGFNAGYGFDVSNNTANLGALIANGASPIFPTPNFVAPGVAGAVAFGNRGSQDGFVGGGQIGYNYQFTPGSGVVVGIEADAQYADFGRARNNNVVLGAAPGTLVFNPTGFSSLDFFGTVRGRIGYAFDRVLFYGTGGFAYGSNGGNQFGAPSRFQDDFQTGWTVGGGVEYALPTDSFLNFFRSSAVTIKVEGLYVNLDRGGNNGAFAVNGANVLFVNSPGVAIGNSQTLAPIALNAIRRDNEFAVVRAGLNYKFGTY